VADNIRVGCAVVAVMGERLLLGRRGKEPFYGKWIIPGGGINLFERYSDTAVREFREETGLEINVRDVLCVAEIIVPPREHRIVIYVAADVVGGHLHASSDLLEVRAFDCDEINMLAAADELTPTVRDVLWKLGWLGPSMNRITFAEPANSRRDESRLQSGRQARIRSAGCAKTRARRQRSSGSDQLQFPFFSHADTRLVGPYPGKTLNDPRRS
jgi:8-oxo-dGTP diphosphatase